jgi:hypothetical protein
MQAIIDVAPGAAWARRVGDLFKIELCFGGGRQWQLVVGRDDIRLQKKGGGQYDSKVSYGGFLFTPL